MISKKIEERFGLPKGKFDYKDALDEIGFADDDIQSDFYQV